ncbi:dermonecrotic toxin domain-containing protein [Pseudomonas sp. PhalM4]
MGELLAAIPRLDVFAERLLLAALREARVADTDVRNSTVTITEQVYYPSVAEKLYRPKGTRVTRQSLLAAALHNYHVSETRPLAGRKGVLTDAHGTVLGLGIEAFAGRCRALDVGGQYQTLLQRQLGTGDAQGKGSPVVRGLIEESLRAQLEVAVRLATLKGELSERHYLQLLPLMASVPIVPPVADAVVARQLYLLGKCIHGVFTFEVQHGDNPAEVIAYVPGMAQQPVRMHASWQAFYDWVAQWLNEAGPRAFFARFILERDRLSFFQALNERLHSRPVGGAANLDGRNLAIDGGLFAHLRGLQLSKLFDDARMLARPTGDEDQADRQARLQGYESLAFDVLGVAGMFVPLLGEVMTVVFAAQIATEVYEGYEDWRLGDRKGALEHLFGVAENVAAGLLISGGGGRHAGAAASAIRRRAAASGRQCRTIEALLVRAPRLCDGCRAAATTGQRLLAASRGRRALSCRERAWQRLLVHSSPHPQRGLRTQDRAHPQRWLAPRPGKPPGVARCGLSDAASEQSPGRAIRCHCHALGADHWF